MDIQEKVVIITGASEGIGQVPEDVPALFQ